MDSIFVCHNHAHLLVWKINLILMRQMEYDHPICHIVLNAEFSQVYAH